jgi:hypothetical protein
MSIEEQLEADAALSKPEAKKVKIEKEKEVVKDEEVKKKEASKKKSPAKEGPTGVVDPTGEFDGKPYYSLDQKKRISISQFKKHTLVDIREFFEKADGTSGPTKKGL